MKNIFRYLGVSVLMAAVVAACSPEEFTHPSEAGVPDATSIEPVITVDQEINQVTFELPAGTKALIPVWLFQDSKGNWTQYSAHNGLKKIFAAAGDYAVRMQLMNSNGLSPNYVEKTFHIDNTMMDFSKYNTMLTGGSEKTWRIDNSVAGHMGCGPSGTTGTEWWAANPDDKKDWGVYDNRMTFALEGNVYTFDPGDAGTIYVNTGITDKPYGDYNTNDGQDYLYPVEVQTAEWSWEVVGEDLFLVLPAKTYWPYYANMEFIADPRFKVESITTKAAELVIDNGGIAWHFSITSGAAEVKFNGFKYDSGFNLWKPVDDNNSFEIVNMFYAHGGAWEGYPEGSMTYTHSGNKWIVNLPYESDQMWQAQFHIAATGISLSADKTYDFSCIVNSTTSFEGVEVKATNLDDNLALFEQRPAVTAYEDCILWASDVPGADIADGNFKLVFDFGGCRENTEITITNIVIKDHANDDGTVLPVTPDEPVKVAEEYKYDAASNLWKAADADHEYKYFYAPGWAQIADPVTVQNGNEYTLTLPEATTDQWQCQFHIIPTVAIPVAAANSYDFSVVLNASNDIKGVTLKLTETTSDENFLFAERVDLTAFEDCIFDISDVKIPADAAGVKMVFDFGGNPANTDVTIKRIVLKDHSSDDGTHAGTGEGGLDTSGTDIWDNSKVTYTWWYSDATWSGTLTPEITEIDGGWKVVVPEGIGGGEWQGQTHFTLDAPASAAKNYDFCVTINSSSDCVCTVKLAWEGNDNDHAFFYDGNVELTAYEDIQHIQSGIAPDTDYDKIALFVDLGRTPAGSEVEIKAIHLYEH
ncbi:MAG: hypothetical protein ACI3ZL_01625 [Candidatus Cryptobacteroides sp.]